MKKEVNEVLVIVGITLVLMGILNLGYFYQVVIGLSIIVLVGFLKFFEIIYKRFSQKDFIEDSEFKVFSINKEMTTREIIEMIKSCCCEPVTFSDLQSFFQGRKIPFKAKVVALDSFWEVSEGSTKKYIPYMMKGGDVDH
jgi:hypothetical protein